MTSPFDLGGKRILLVGSTGVLGSEFARILHKSGAELILADLESSSIKLLAEELGVNAVNIDVTNEDSVVSAVASTVSTFGGLDGVVSNAAITSEFLSANNNVFPPFEDYPLKDWKQTIDVNLTGTFLVAREAGRAIKNCGGGSIVLTSSIYGVVGPDHSIYEGQSFRSLPGYSASKSGIIGLARWLATWWAEDNIRVNALSPGGVKNRQPVDFVANYSSRTPLGRMANPSDIAASLVFLLSDASSYYTGQNLIVDGGLTAW